MKPSIKYTSELFESIPENSGHLAITISEDECEIGVTSSTDFLTFLVKYTREKDQDQLDFIREAFSTNQALFSKTFKSIVVGLANNEFTLIPSSFQGQPSDYLNVITSTSQKTVYRENLDGDYDFIYSVDDDLHDLFKNTFQHYEVKHLSKLFYNRESKRDADLVAVFSHGAFDCFVKKNGRSISLARHQYETVEDLTYFILLSLKDAGIGSEQTKAYLSGTIVKTSAIYDSLFKYIDSIVILEPEMLTRPRHDFQEPLRYHYHLLNLLDAHN